MSDAIGSATGPKHFNPEEEAALRRETTNDVIKRDTKVDGLNGRDTRQRHVKEAQQDHVGGKGIIEIASSASDAAAVGGLVPELGFIGLAIDVLSPVAALGLGAWTLIEAHKNGEEQNVAVGRENAHVALIGALDLPEAYKACRYEKFPGVERDFGKVAYKTMESIRADKKGLAVLQLHADRGMNAARDMARSGMTLEAFSKTNPKFAEAYAKDAAFQEGFNAYTVTKGTPDQSELDAKLDQRDAWYTQSTIPLRV